MKNRWGKKKKGTKIGKEKHIKEMKGKTGKDGKGILQNRP